MVENLRKIINQSSVKRSTRLLQISIGSTKYRSIADNFSVDSTFWEIGQLAHSTWSVHGLIPCFWPVFNTAKFYKGNKCLWFHRSCTTFIHAVVCFHVLLIEILFLCPGQDYIAVNCQLDYVRLHQIWMHWCRNIALQKDIALTM